MLRATRKVGKLLAVLEVYSYVGSKVNILLNFNACSLKTICIRIFLNICVEKFIKQHQILITLWIISKTLLIQGQGQHREIKPGLHYRYFNLKSPTLWELAWWSRLNFPYTGRGLCILYYSKTTLSNHNHLFLHSHVKPATGSYKSSSKSTDAAKTCSATGSRYGTCASACTTVPCSAARTTSKASLLYWTRTVTIMVLIMWVNFTWLFFCSYSRYILFRLLIQSDRNCKKDKKFSKDLIKFPILSSHANLSFLILSVRKNRWE